MSRRRKLSSNKAWIPSAVPFFVFGLVYYLLSPPLVFEFLSDRSQLLYLASKYLDSSYFDIGYFLDAFVILASFLIGYMVPRFRTASKNSVLDYGSFQRNSSSLVAIALYALVLYFSSLAVASGGGFFTGYSSYNIAVLGPFSTATFLAVWLFNYFSRRQIRILFLGVFAVCSTLLLGWGSRMFFTLSFVSLVLGLVSRKRELLKSVQFYSVAVSFCFLMIAVGILRVGGREISADGLMATFFAEPLFTSISGSLYLENTGGRPFYGVPTDLFASIIHFIPSVIYPGKVEFIGEITYNENIQSPFGAKALIVNLYTNFGFFYPIFIGLVGVYYRFLYEKARVSIFFRATYFSALPILLFLFFREGLATVIKVTIFNGLAVPLIISAVLIWLSPRSLGEIKSKMSRGDGVAGFVEKRP